MYTVSIYALSSGPICGTKLAQHTGNRSRMLETVGDYMLADDAVSVDATRFDGQTGFIGIRGNGKETFLKIEKLG